MTYDEAIEKIGLDKEGTLKRFSGNEALMKKFVLKFTQDKTLSGLKLAVQNKDYPSIEETSHTLKGVSGNLGFTKLYEDSAALCNAVREKDFSKADSLAPKVIELCESINGILSSVE